MEGGGPLVTARLFSLFFASILLVSAANKAPGTAKGENEDLSISATLYLEPAAIKELIGSDLDGHYIVVDVKVTPKYGKEVNLQRDDFVLRTDKDGEKSKPFVGNQIAGQASLIVSEDGSEARKSRGWSMGGPVMMGGGNGNDSDKPRTSTMKSSESANPLKKVLDERILPEKKIDQPVSGLLYFPLEKQKMKDLELRFGGTENRISLRFKQER